MNHKILKRELRAELKRRKIQKQFRDYIIKDQCEHTKLKLMSIENGIATIYFYTILNSGAFGKATVSVYNRFDPPIVELITLYIHWIFLCFHRRLRRRAGIR